MNFSPEAIEAIAVQIRLSTDVDPKKIEDIKLGNKGWREYGACAGLLAEPFLLEPGQSPEPGRAICRQCIVITPCLEQGLIHDVVDAGYSNYDEIWGGMTSAERAFILIQRVSEQEIAA